MRVFALSMPPDAVMPAAMTPLIELFFERRHAMPPPCRR